jgi:SpoVK/Ycf46/Vps4 family AAA+-type ATPase
MADDLSPSIICLDNCDSMMVKRSSSESEWNLDIVCTLLDRITSFKRVNLICVTNLPCIIDNVFIRRLDFWLPADLPTEKERAVMFKSSFAALFNVITHDEFIQLAKMSDRLSGSDIDNLRVNWMALLRAEARDATHFKICPFRRTKLIPCSSDDPGAKVIKLFTAVSYDFS